MSCLLAQMLGYFNNTKCESYLNVLLQRLSNTNPPRRLQRQNLCTVRLPPLQLKKTQHKSASVE